MIDKDFREGDAKTNVFGSDAMMQPAPVDKIPEGPTTPQIAYQMVKDETLPKPNRALTWPHSSPPIWTNTPPS